NKVRAAREHYARHVQDETQLETTPQRCRTWHRTGHQPTLPGVGTSRRVTVFGSVDVLRRTRHVELVRAAQDSAGIVRSLDLLPAHHRAVGREIYLVLANASVHTSQESLQARARARALARALA